MVMRISVFGPSALTQSSENSVRISHSSGYAVWVKMSLLLSCLAAIMCIARRYGLLLLEIAALMCFLSFIERCDLSSLGLSGSCSLMMISLSLFMDSWFWFDEGGDQERGAPACCAAIAAHVITTSLYDFLMVGEALDEKGSTDIVSIVFFMIETVALVADRSAWIVWTAASISFMDDCSLTLLTNSRQLCTYGKSMWRGLIS